MNTRKDNNGRALKAWKKMPPGHIAKPLRHIANRTNGFDAQGRVIVSAHTMAARDAANRGHGHVVTNMARSLGF